MKHLSFLILAVLSAVGAFAQVEDTPLMVGKASIGQSGGGAGFWQVSGSFVDESGFHDASSIAVGDYVFFSDAGFGYHLPITQVVSVAPPSFTVRVSNVGIVNIANVPTTLGAVYRPTPNRQLGPFTAGLTAPDQQTLSNYMMQLLDAGGGGGSNLSTIVGPANVTIDNSGGTDAVIPLATGTNAGLLSPTNNIKLGDITVTQPVDLDAIEAQSHPPVTVTDDASIDLTLVGQNITAVLSRNGATTGQVLKWNGTAWVPLNETTVTTNNLVGTTRTTITNGTSAIVGASPVTVDVNEANLNPANIPINDTGGFFPTDNINAALQQLGASSHAPVTVADGTIIDFTLTGQNITATVLAGSITTTQIADGTIGTINLSSMGATAGQSLRWNGTAWVPYTVALTYSAPDQITINGGNTITIQEYVGATNSNPGESGLVQAPGIPELNRFLVGNGGWSASIVEWQPNQAYKIGDIVYNGTDRKIYQVTADHSTATFVPNNFSELSRDNDLVVLGSYNALRAFTGTANAVLVRDFTYTFNGENYTTLGGLFFRSTGTEDGATRIVATNAVTWERVWDKTQTLPEWWEVGAYDVDGTSNPTRFTTNGIFNDRDRATAAHRKAGVGGTIFYGAVVKRYKIDKSIMTQSNQLVKGNRVQFDRMISPAVVSTSSIVGVTSFTVSDASQFRVGMTIVGLDTANTRGAPDHMDGRSYRETTRDAVITAISGNTITIDVAFRHPNDDGGFGFIQPGQRIIRTNGMFIWCSGDDGSDDCPYGSGGGGQVYEDVFINGNRNNGNNGDFPYAYWLNTWSVEPGNGAQNVVFDRCQFKNTPCENVLAASGAMRNCIGRNLGGSFFHYVEGNPATVARKPNPFSVTGCIVDSVCWVTNIKSGHSEACILVSNNSEWGEIDGNTIKNCREAVFSIVAEEQTLGFNLDFKVRFSNNHAENCRIILANVNVGSSTQLYPQRSIIMEHNTFLQCGDFWMDFEILEKGKGAFGIQFNHNTVIGGRLYFNHCDNVMVEGNTMLFNSELHRNKWNNRIDTRDYWLNYSNNYFNVNASAIAVQNSRNVKINNNIIEGFETQNDSLICGINAGLEWFGLPLLMKNDNGVGDSDFFYAQNIEVTNNTVANFPYGICAASRPGRNLGGLFDFNNIAQGWKIDHNTVYMQKAPVSAQATYGISSMAGMDVTNNRIYKQSSEVDDIPLVVFGLNAAGSVATRRAGWRVSNNLLHTGSTTENALLVGSTNFGVSNILMTENAILGVVDADSSFYTDSYFVNNTIVNASILPRLTAPSKVLYNSYMKNKAAY
jgi:hypothetical protein